MIKLDLKNFKHIKSDKDTTTLQHPHGHSITLTHKVLSPENRQQLTHLAKMAQGGQAQEPVSPAPSTAPDRPTPAPIKNNELDNAGGWSGALSNAAKEFGLSKAEGGAVKPNTIDYSKFKEKPKPAAPTTLNYKDLKQEYKNKNRFKMAEGGNPANPSLAESKKSIASSNPNMMTPTGSLEQMVNCWAEGGSVTAAYDAGLPCLNPNCKSHGKPHPNCRCYSPHANGGEVGKLRYCAHGMPHMAGCEYAKGGQVSEDNLASGKGGVSEQGEDIRAAYNTRREGAHNPHPPKVHEQFAKAEAKGRAAMERHVKPNLKGLAKGGAVQQAQQSPMDTVTDNYVEGGAIAQSGPTMDMHAKGGNVNPSLQQSKKSAPKRFPSMALENLECASDEPGNQGGGMAEGGQIPMNIRHYDGGGNIDDDFKNVPPGKQRKMYAEGGPPLPIPGGGVSPTPDKSAIDKLIDMKHAETMPKDEAGTERDIDKFEAQQPPTTPELNMADRQRARQQDQQLAPEDQPAQEVNDTEQPPTGPDIHGNDHYGHLDTQGNDQDQQAPNQAQMPQQAQAQDSNNVIPQAEMQPPDVANQLAQSHLQENQAFQQDLNNGHITPKTYSDLFHYNKDGSERSTLGKIGMIFGMMVGGAGSGLAHQPNVALGMMDNVIKNDLAAQEKSKDNAQNFLKINQARLLNNAQVQQALSSSQLTQTQKQALLQSIKMKSYTQAYMDMASASLFDQIQKIKTLPEGTAKQQAVQTAMLTAAAIEKNNAQAAVVGASGVKSLGSMYGGTDTTNAADPEQQFQNAMQNRENMGDKAAADSLRERHIPGVPGFASQPVPEEMRSKFRDMDVLDNKVKDVLDFAQKHRGSVNPAVLKQARQKAEELTSFYNKSVDSLGMTQGRLGWLEEQIKKNPTSLIQQLLGNNATLREIQQSNEGRKNLQLKKLGFPVQTPTQAPQYKTDANGVRWMRGPNGEAIRVK